MHKAHKTLLFGLSLFVAASIFIVANPKADALTASHCGLQNPYKPYITTGGWITGRGTVDCEYYAVGKHTYKTQAFLQLEQVVLGVKVWNTVPSGTAQTGTVYVMSGATHESHITDRFDVLCKSSTVNRNFRTRVTNTITYTDSQGRTFTSTENAYSTVSSLRCNV